MDWEDLQSGVFAFVAGFIVASLALKAGKILRELQPGVFEFVVSFIAAFFASVMFQVMYWENCNLEYSRL